MNVEGHSWVSHWEAPAEDRQRSGYLFPAPSLLASRFVRNGVSFSTAQLCEEPPAALALTGL